jgi:hypothetical protein
MATTKNPNPTAAGARKAIVEGNPRISILRVVTHADAVRVFLNRDADRDAAACLLAARYPGATIKPGARVISIVLAAS